MKDPGRRYESAVSAAVVAVFATSWVFGVVVASGGLPKDPKPGLSYVANLVVAWVLVATQWMVAFRLLWRAWWDSTGHRQSRLDAPAGLLAAAAAMLPDDRRDLGVAMLAELAQVRGRWERWRFAAGCARAAVFPPCGSGVTVLGVGALAVAMAVSAEQAVGSALPAMRVFAAAFVGLVGTLAVLGVARSRRVRPPGSGPAVTAAGLAGVAGCIAAAGYFLARYPAAAVYLSPAAAVFLAAVLACCTWLVLAPPRGLTTNRLARGIAVGSAVALGVGLVAASRLGLCGVEGFKEGLFGYLFLVPTAIVFVGSAVAATAGRSFRAGVQATVWTAILGSLAVYAVGLLEALVWYRSNSSLIFMGDGVPVDAAGENLRGFASGLVLLPSWWLPFGVIGAAIGRRLRGAPPFRPPLSENPQW